MILCYVVKRVIMHRYDAIRCDGMGWDTMRCGGGIVWHYFSCSLDQELVALSTDPEIK